MKNMRVFCQITGLIELEQTSQWDKARILLIQKWEHNKSAEHTLRLISECWYVLVMWELIENTNKGYDDFIHTLQKSTRFGCRNYTHDATFLCIVGYMISLMPHLFVRENSQMNYSQTEIYGKELLYRAKVLEKNNILIDTLYSGFQKYTTERPQTETEKLKPVLHEYFPGNSAIELYFKEILKNENKE